MMLIILYSETMDKAPNKPTVAPHSMSILLRGQCSKHRCRNVTNKYVKGKQAAFQVAFSSVDRSAISALGVPSAELERFNVASSLRKASISWSFWSSSRSFSEHCS